MYCLFSGSQAHLTSQCVSCILFRTAAVEKLRQAIYFSHAIDPRLATFRLPLLHRAGPLRRPCVRALQAVLGQGVQERHQEPLAHGHKDSGLSHHRQHYVQLPVSPAMLAEVPPRVFVDLDSTALGCATRNAHEPWLQGEYNTHTHIYTHIHTHIHTQHHTTHTPHTHTHTHTTIHAPQCTRVSSTLFVTPFLCLIFPLLICSPVFSLLSCSMFFRSVGLIDKHTQREGMSSLDIQFFLNRCMLQRRCRVLLCRSAH